MNHKLFVFARLSTLNTYYTPKDGPLLSYREYIAMLPNNDNSEAFGQHQNADVASQIKVGEMMFFKIGFELRA